MNATDAKRAVRYALRLLRKREPDYEERSHTFPPLTAPAILLNTDSNEFYMVQGGAYRCTIGNGCQCGIKVNHFHTLPEFYKAWQIYSDPLLRAIQLAERRRTKPNKKGKT